MGPDPIKSRGTDPVGKFVCRSSLTFDSNAHQAPKA